MQFTLRNARLVDATMDKTNGDITIDGAYISDVGNIKSQNVIDATNTIIMPGFIDVHTHGVGGFNLHTTNVQEILSYAHWVTKTGVTSFLIAVVGTPSALPEQQLRTAVAALEQHQEGINAQPLGIHLEGPYISEKRRGAHLPAWLRLPDEHETAFLLQITQGHLRLVTLAPELPGAEHMIRRLVAANVTVSIGHTNANYEQTRSALELGITHATHCFNAMPPLLHREPGPLPAIAQAQQVYGEVIVDGVHVHPAVVDMLVRMLGPARVILVTDAQAVAGIHSEGPFEFAGQQAHIERGAVRLVDGTLAGSVLTMDKALPNILSMTGVSLQEAVSMLTRNPAESLHVATRKGMFHVGYDADLLIFDEALSLQATFCRGQVAFATEAWRERLQMMNR